MPEGSGHLRNWSAEMPTQRKARDVPITHSPLVVSRCDLEAAE